MKNIHLIPTDKPSRLYEFGGQIILTNELTDAFRNQNIYITNDEEIKKGDWVYHPEVSQEYTKVNLLKEGNERYTKGQHVAQGVYKHKPTANEWYKKERKIILTTDESLIADGVESIPDDFLEWFVKNPSCGEIQVEKSFHWDNGVYEYEIIIPKEEPKQIDEKGNPLTYWGGLEEPKQIYQQIIDVVGGEDKFKEIAKIKPKQETLEEAAERLYPTTIDSFTDNGFDLSERERLIFINSAKWQQERMYSEEDMRKCWDACKRFERPISEGYAPNFNEFIGQYKKK
jgi:hypothetical protein